jgi:hypothetical protein
MQKRRNSSQTLLVPLDELPSSLQYDCEAVNSRAAGQAMQASWDSGNEGKQDVYIKELMQKEIRLKFI